MEWQAVNLARQGPEIKNLICLLKLEEPLKEFMQGSDVIGLVL